MAGEGIRQGELGDVDEKFATLLILSSMNWIYQWYRPDGPMTPEEIARKLTEMLLNGLRRGAGGGRKHPSGYRETARRARRRGAHGRPGTGPGRGA